MRLMRILGLLLFAAIAGVSEASAQIVSITIAPPVLPVYEQPAIPGPGYIWTPGYWAWGDDGYYWVPGTWILPPAVGLLWTPGYWGWRDGIYLWNAGYWGPHIGFYGGINYGFGYTGVGYAGGFWRGGVFSYNRTVNNFGSVNITNVYNKTVINNNVNVTKVSFNGGTGGTTVQPTQQERAAASEQHTAMTQQQQQHQTQAGSNPQQYAKNNNGQPTVGATSHAAQFKGQGVVGAKGVGGATGSNTTAGGTGKGATGGNAASANPTIRSSGTGTQTKATTSAGGAGLTSTRSTVTTNAHPMSGATQPGAGNTDRVAPPPRVATSQRPVQQNFRGPPPRVGGGLGGPPRQGGGGGQHKGPQQHH